MFKIKMIKYTATLALRISLILTALVYVSACSLMNFNTHELKPIKVEFAEPNRIQFQGKGAGAGIALMSTMGPVGIALGVAIDEGIAKDIRKAIGKEKTDATGYLKNQVAAALTKQGYSVASNDASLNESHFPKIIIKRMGFKITNGSTDATAAEWELELHSAPDTKVKISYPKDFAKGGIKSYVLADLKTDGKLGLELLNESLVKALNALLIKANSKM